jgi:copper chaperone CopZ
VQSALEALEGVKEVTVSLEAKKAVVKYDPEVVKIEDLIKAVKNARGMNSYDAKIKKK